MSKVFFRERIIADYNVGSPLHISRVRVDFKELAKRILLIALVALIIFFIGVEIYAYATAPQITVSCSDSNWLIFQDEYDRYLGKVRSASPEQLEQIKLIKKIVIDPSVNNFIPSENDTEFFEITLAGYGNICFDSDKCMNTPREYNHTLSNTEETEIFSLMSEEHKFLYDELNFIICDGTA